MRPKLKKGYTLIELTTVVVLMVLIVGGAVPAFNSYGRNREFEGKINETTELLNQAHALSRNPERDIKIYEVMSDLSSDPHRFVLRKCSGITNLGVCDPSGSVYEIIGSVQLLENEVIQTSGQDPYVACTTGPEGACTASASPSQLNIWDTDEKIRENDMALFTIGVPFRVSVERKES